MKRVTIYLVVLILAVFLGLYFISLKTKSPPEEVAQTVINLEDNPIIMELKSSAFEDGGVIPSKYTCDGGNINPPLSITGVPEDAKSLVIIMDDHDVPKSVRSDGVWDHWVVFNIPPNLNVINEGEKITGIYGKTSGGKTEYGGPCPPDREHRYMFYLYALDGELSLPSGSTKSEVLNAMNGHILEKTTLVGKYNRKR